MLDTVAFHEIYPMAYDMLRICSLVEARLPRAFPALQWRQVYEQIAYQIPGKNKCTSGECKKMLPETQPITRNELVGAGSSWGCTYIVFPFPKSAIRKLFEVLVNASLQLIYFLYPEVFNLWIIFHFVFQQCSSSAKFGSLYCEANLQADLNEISTKPHLPFTPDPTCTIH